MRTQGRRFSAGSAGSAWIAMPAPLSPIIAGVAVGATAHTLTADTAVVERDRAIARRACRLTWSLKFSRHF
jgi:hypothetical protein